jgi:Phosphotransferase enzyme family
VKPVCKHPQNEREECRLIVFRGSGSEILLSAESGAAGLPVISIPRYTRIAQSVSEAAQEQWNIAIYSLFSLPPRECPGETSRYQLAALRSTTSILPNMAWVAPRSLTPEGFRDPQDYAALQEAVELVQNYSKNPTNGFFARPGWLEEVLGRTQAEAYSLGLVPTGRFHQLNAGPTFSLIRMETNDRALWLKAVGQSHIHEFRITMELSRLFPKFLPRIVAKWEEQNAWLMIEAEGSHPDQSSARSVWVRVATALARLEIASMGRGLHLIDLGCRDVRVCTLRILLPPFVEAMTELMQQQTKEEPSPLSRNELSALRAQLGEIFLKLEELAIPNILTHLDFNPGNIVVSRSSSTFLDWAEASVGPCFLTLQLLLEHVQRLIPDNPLLAPSIISAYRHEWSNCESSEALDEMLSASPLVAVSAYALNLWSSHNEKREMDKRTAGYLRSLTRRIKREAEVFATRRTLCAH